MFEQNLADLFGGIHVLLLNIPEKFHYLSPKHVNVTSSSSVPTFCNFSENRLFLDGEVENSEFSENSETSENQFPEVFNSEFSVLYFTQNRKIGVEHLGDLL